MASRRVVGRVRISERVINRHGGGLAGTANVTLFSDVRADAPTRRKCARNGREQVRNDLRIGAAHSITSSARASSDAGTSSPSDLAVLRLMTSSNLVGCKTGRSAGFSPLRIRPV